MFANGCFVGSVPLLAPHLCNPCIESQCDYKTVSAILGHSNVATTLNLYVHPNIHQKKKCIERMNKFLGIAEQ